MVVTSYHRRKEGRKERDRERERERERESEREKERLLKECDASRQFRN